MNQDIRLVNFVEHYKLYYNKSIHALPLTIEWDEDKVWIGTTPPSEGCLVEIINNEVYVNGRLADPDWLEAA